ncbi:MAG: hypothetical protein CFE41_11775 [Burkholderiales bacterium PBB2]|nr:MAG: hypothetical protein CFE41_11775 [Burkholderiales bacterium PBB2]
MRLCPVLSSLSATLLSLLHGLGRFTRPVACLALLLALGPLAQAGSGLQSLRFEPLSAERAGLQAILYSAQQDARGLMWLGTSAGLYRFDGRAAQHFGSEPADAQTLSHPAVRSLLLLPGERLLIGTERGLDEMDLRSETLRRHGLPSERHMRERYVLGLQPASEGQVWVMTGLDLQRFDPQQRQFQPVRLPTLEPLVPGRKAGMAAMASDGAQGVWLVAGRHLMHLDAQGRLQQRWPLASFGKAEPGVRSLVIDGQQRAWLGTNAGVQLIDTRSGEVLDLPARWGLPPSLVHTVYRDQDDGIWVGTGNAGLWHWRPGSERFESHVHHPALPDSVFSNAISALFQDRSGVLWVGTWGWGVSLADLRSGGFRAYRSVVGDGSSLSSDSVMAVAADGADHAWVATYGGGLNRLQLSSGEAERISATQLPMRYLKALLLQPERGLWVGGDEGLFLLDLKRRQAQRVDFGERLGGGMSIAALALDAQGQLWAASAAGAYRFAADGRVTRYRREPGQAGQSGGLSNEVIDCLLPDREGRLWLGSKGGLQLWDAAQQRFSQPVRPSVDLPQPSELAIYALRQDRQGRIWAGTQLGLYELLQNAEGVWQFKSWRGLAGMPKGWVHSLELVDDDGLWFASPDGLSRLDPERRSLRHYPSRSGHFRGNFAQGGSARGVDGQLLYGGDGLLRFKPSELHDNPVAPPVVLADVRIFNRSLLDPSQAVQRAGEAASSLATLGVSGPLAQAEHLRLSHHEAMVSFDLRAQHFFSAGRLRYAWKLEGFDQDWIHGSDGEGLATYTNLDAGRYRLLARAANPDGVWGDPRQLLTIEVQPPWWRSWSVRLLMLALLAASLAAAWQLRLRRLRQVQQELERQVELRTAQVRAQRQQIATVSDIGRELTASLDLAAVQQALYRQVESLMPALIFGVGLLRAEEGEGGVVAFDFVIDRGRPLLPYRRSLSRPDQPAARCILQGAPQWERDIAHDNRLIDPEDLFAPYRPDLPAGQALRLASGEEPTRARSGLYVPLQIKGQVKGLICVLSDQVDAYRQTDLDLLQALAAYAAVALDNADAYAQLRRTQTQLFEQEKLASLGSLVAGVAHELNTPLGNSLLAASTLQDGTREFKDLLATGQLRRSELQTFCDTTEASAGLLVRGLASAAGLVSSFKQLAVDQTSERRRLFELQQLCEEVQLSLINRLRKDGHQLQIQVEPGLSLDSYPGPLGQVLSNLVLNSIIHGFEGRQNGQMRIEAEAAGAERVRLRFRDNGRGIAPEHLSRVFDPFFTTKLGSGGSGLGLHLCYTIVRSMLGGEITVSSTAGEGAQFELLLPRVAPAAVPAAGAAGLEETGGLGAAL